MISVLVCLSAWLVMSLAVARVSYRRARAKVLDTIEDRMGAVEVATIRSQAHRDGVNEARWMFFLYPVIVPAMCVTDLVKMIVIGRPAKTVTETNWETAQQLREVQRQIEQLEDRKRHDELTADDPARPHVDCGVCKTKSYPARPAYYYPGMTAAEAILARPPVQHGSACKLCVMYEEIGERPMDHGFVPLVNDRPEPLPPGYDHRKVMWCTPSTCASGAHGGTRHIITIPKPGTRYDAP